MPRDPAGYRLPPGAVPEFPQSTLWMDLLRWALVVMDHDDPDLGFVASLLSYCCERGGLTEKQGKYARRAVDRVRALWVAEQLQCQRRPHASRATTDLLATAAVGSA